jgi:hypothetical protein
MNFWINFWAIFFFASLALFAGLAVVVTIGGFFNIQSLFKSLIARAGQQEKRSSEKDDEQT